MSRQRTLQDYLNETREQKLDTRLQAYLTTILDDLDENPDAGKLKHILAELALVLPMHFSRKHFDLIRDGGASVVKAALSEVSLRGDRLADFLEICLSSLPDLRHPLVWALPDPITIAGYDPRFSSFPPAAGHGNATKARYASMLDKLERHDQWDDPVFFDSYPQSKANIYRDFHDKGERYDLLVVDLVWLPELAYQGNVLPLERFDPNIEDHIKQTMKSDLWGRVGSELTKGGNSYHYGLPLFLNAHGRFIPTKNQVPTFEKISEQTRYPSSRYESLCGEVSGCASLQAKPSASCVYQLYAHFAYEGAVPIEVASGADEKAEVRLDFSSRAVGAALAKLLARIRALGSRPFRVGHDVEVNDLRMMETIHWAPALSSELSQPLKETGFQLLGPFKAEERHSWLTSLGGYALAISAKSVDPLSTYRFAVDLQRQVLDEESAIPEFEGDPFPGVDPGEFLRLHSRPRIPFWSQVEEILSFTVEELWQAFWEERPELPESQGFEPLFSAIEEWIVTSPKAGGILRMLGRKVALCFGNNGWIVREGGEQPT